MYSFQTWNVSEYGVVSLVVGAAFSALSQLHEQFASVQLIASTHYTTLSYMLPSICCRGYWRCCAPLLQLSACTCEAFTHCLSQLEFSSSIATAVSLSPAPLCITHDG